MDLVQLAMLKAMSGGSGEGGSDSSYELPFNVMNMVVFTDDGNGGYTVVDNYQSLTSCFIPCYLNGDNLYLPINIETSLPSLKVRYMITDTVNNVLHYLTFTFNNGATLESDDSYTLTPAL